MRRSLLAIVSIAAVGGCQFDADYSGTRYKCPDNECPSGFTCVDQRCVSTTGDDAASADAAAYDGAAADASAIDATPASDAGVCELAAAQPNNDGCGDAIILSSGTTVHGNTMGYASDLDPSVACHGRTTAGGDAIYAIDATAGQMLTVTMEPEDWDGSVYLLATCGPTSPCVIGADDHADSQAETFTTTLSTTARYFIVVDSATVPQTGCFALTANLE